MPELWWDKYRKKLLTNSSGPMEDSASRLKNDRSGSCPISCLAGPRSGQDLDGEAHLQELNIQPGDVLEINGVASVISTRARQNHDVRHDMADRRLPIQVRPARRSDHMNPLAQGALRVEMEKI